MASSKAVFISYASEDVEAADRISESLRGTGIEIWFDRSELRGGDAWDQKIRRHIRDCALFLPVISANTNARAEGYFRLEWKLAVDRSHLMATERAFFLPVVIDATTDGNALVPDRFREVQWTRLPAGEPPAAFVDLVSRLLQGSGDTVHVAAPKPAQQVSKRPERSEVKVSIAVLPFANMSGDAEQEYFSDGITEDIITDLSKVSALWVAARNTVFTLKGKHVDTQQTARALNVSHLLEGSVRKSGNRVRITAQLIDGASGGHIWAERYDRDLNDIFALQDEISEAIVAALRIKLLPEEKSAIEQRGTNNLEAYKMFLLARQLSVNANSGDTRRSEAIIRLCRRAIEIDPHYAQPWALIAKTQISLRLHSFYSSEDAEVAADRALALDPTLAEAHAVKARSLALAKHYDQALHHVETALRLNPESHEANTAAAYWHLSQRQFREAIPYWEKAMSLVETDYSSAAMLATCYDAIGDRDGALRVAQTRLERTQVVVAREPDNGSALGYMFGALSRLGETARAKEVAERALLLDPENLNMRYNFACGFARDLGDYETAIDLLETIFKIQKPTREALNWAKTDPDLDPLRSHPRFIAMMAAGEALLAQT